MTQLEIEAKELLLKTMDWFNVRPGLRDQTSETLLRDITNWFRQWQIKAHQEQHGKPGNCAECGKPHHLGLCKDQ